jgi:selenophosphate synthetase-related protein
MSIGAEGRSALEELAGFLREHRGLQAKREIRLVSDVLGPASWVHGPGDDGAVVETSARGGKDDAGVIIACGEALLPEFVARDPYGAGVAAVLTNVNDLAAMGAVPRAIVDTVVGSTELAKEVLRGMRDACSWYDVVLAGGHLTVHDGAPALSAFGVGEADGVLSVTRVEPGQSLVVAACTDGTMRTDFPFFRSFAERGDRLGDDVRVLSQVAATGACVAAKDVSMAGLVGSLAMLLEWSRLGVTLDLDRLPRPADVSLADWLTCFPAYAFLLCAPSGREAACLAAFQDRGLAASVVGEIDESGVLALSASGHRSPVVDLGVSDVTGLAR